MEKMPYRIELDTVTMPPAVAPVVSSNWQQGLPTLAGEPAPTRASR